MINLIPKQEEERIIRDFYLRVLAAFFLILGFAVSIASVTLLPSFIFSMERKDFVLDKLEQTVGQPVSRLDKEAQETIKNLEGMLSSIEASKKTNYIVTEKIIDKVLAKKIPGIKITKISYNNSADGKEVGISGIASDRENLLTFRRAFENDADFKKVDLPISNFVKGSNIIFYLNIVPA